MWLCKQTFMSRKLILRITVALPEMILGVCISTKPLLVRVSLNSWQTPDCRRKIAWLVVVCGRVGKANGPNVTARVTQPGAKTPSDHTNYHRSLDLSQSSRRRNVNLKRFSKVLILNFYVCTGFQVSRRHYTNLKIDMLHECICHTMITADGFTQTLT